MESESRPAYLFKPGVSGNPSGRPKGPSPLGVLRALLDEAYDGTRSKLEAFWSRVFDDAMKGEAAAQRLIADRIAPIKLDLKVSEGIELIVRDFTGQTREAPKVIEGEVVKEEKT